MLGTTDVYGLELPGGLLMCLHVSVIRRISVGVLG